MTARENLHFFARLYAVQESNLDQLLDVVGLKKHGDQLVRTFSRGMQQRLSLARALLHSPDILILDEPFTGLDRHFADELETILQQMKARACTILMTTHQQGRLINLMDRVMILHRGQLRYDQPMNEGSLDQLASIYHEHTHMVTS